MSFIDKFQEDELSREELDEMVRKKIAELSDDCEADIASFLA